MAFDLLKKSLRSLQKTGSVLNGSWSSKRTDPIGLFRRKKFLISLFVLVFISIPIGFLSLKNARPTVAAWFDDSWLYRKAIAIPSHTAAENNVYVTVPSFDATGTSKFQSDCGDLRFTKQNGELLPYYVVDCDATATIHVQFDTLPAGSSTYFMYYGNPTAQNGFSSADFSSAASGLGTQALASEEKSVGPVAYWKFDEGYGTTANDSTRNANNGSLGVGSSAPTWQTEDQCISGKCLDFDGNDYVSKSGSPISGDQAFTISAWVKKTGTMTGYHGAVSFGSQSSAQTAYIGMFSGGTLGGGWWGEQWSTNTTPETGQWYHLAMSYAGGTNGVVKIYVNGVEKTNQTKTSSINSSVRFGP